MNDKLVRNPDVVWREEPRGRSKVLEEGAQADTPCLTLVHLGTMYQVNFTAAEIWKLCDGTRGVNDLVEELFPIFSVSRETLKADVTAFVKEMLTKGWLRWS